LVETLEALLDLTSDPKGARANTSNVPRIWGFGGALVLSVFAAACTAQSVGVSADDRSATDFRGSVSAIFESGDNPEYEYANNVLDANGTPIETAPARAWGASPGQPRPRRRPR
jgi:hypothetical protein